MRRIARVPSAAPTSTNTSATAKPSASAGPVRPASRRRRPDADPRSGPRRPVCRRGPHARAGPAGLPGPPLDLVRARITGGAEIEPGVETLLRASRPDYPALIEHARAEEDESGTHAPAFRPSVRPYYSRIHRGSRVVSAVGAVRRRVPR